MPIIGAQEQAIQFARMGYAECSPLIPESAMRPTRLDDAAAIAALAALNRHSSPAWTIQDGTLQKTFLFHDFRQAFAFMTRVAEAAETLDHHPDWRNVYNRVQVVLSTHDVDGITGLDFSLAEAMEAAIR